MMNMWIPKVGDLVLPNTKVLVNCGPVLVLSVSRHWFDGYCLKLQEKIICNATVWLPFAPEVLP